jgi:hypothetical protein
MLELWGKLWLALFSFTTSAKKGFRIQQWVPHQKQKFHATAVVIAASISAWMRQHWFLARHATS